MKQKVRSFRSQNTCGCGDHAYKEIGTPKKNGDSVQVVFCQKCGDRKEIKL
jgi:hypothetical protein